jgi:uncharacterized membrane protein HdeD (DUF308 family)
MIDPALAVQPNARSSGWSIVLRGILACIFGILILANPSVGVAMLIVMFAVYAAVDGVAALATAVDHGRAGLRWGWWLFEGLVSLAVAALALARPGITLLALVLLIAFRAILLGLIELGGALGGKGLDHRWLLGVTGVVSVLFGVLMLGNPVAGTMAVVWVIGVYAVVFGVMLVIVGVRALGARHDHPDVDTRQYAT